MTNVDALTGTPDRAALFHALDVELTQGRPVALLIIDLDHFKSINDAFGHLRGDAALLGVTRRALATLGAGFYRYAGDEFVALLTGSDVEDALGHAERLVRAVAAEPVLDDPPLSVTISVGVAVSNEGVRRTPEELFEAADRALYAAKRAGRGRAALAGHTHAAEDETPDVGRLVEREGALAELRTWLDDLPRVGRSVLAIDGPSGVGRSRFFVEVERSARLQGFAAVTLRPTGALGARLYGAIAEADWSFLGERDPQVPLLERLRRHLQDKRRAGLVIAVDDPESLDPASLGWVQEALVAGGLPVVGLVTLAHETVWRHGVDEPERRLSLAPLTATGTRSWLRSRLRAELPDDVAVWLHDRTGGLPGRLEEAARVVSSLPGDHVSVTALRAALDLAPQPVRALPPLEGGFVGRDAEINALRQLLSRERLVSLVGPGGIGKTRLAAQVAHELLPAFADGVALVPLAGERPDGIDAAIARTLGIELHGLDIHARLAEWFRARSVLLVLDNFEHLLDAGDVALRLMRESPGLRLLVTTREPLGVPAERRVELRGLPFDDAPPVGGDVHGATAFFLHAARRAAPDLTFGQEQLDDVHALCAQVEGSPLALELAAAWLPTLSPRDILAGVRRDLAFLEEQPRNASSEPHGDARRSLRAVLGHFWAQLGEHEAVSVRQLGVFRGPFSTASARRVAGASPFLLAGLVSRAYLTRRGGGFVLHEFLRQDAHERLSAREGEYRRAERALRDHYLDLALTELSGGAYDAERDNLLLALDLALEHAALSSTARGHEDAGLLGDRAARAALALARPRRLRGEAREALAAVERATGVAEDAAVRCECRVAAGELRNLLGDARGAEEAFMAALTDGGLADGGLTEGTPTDGGVSAALRARALCGLARATHRRGETVRSQELALEAVAVARELGDPGLEGQCRRALSRSLLTLREPGEAREQARLALSLYEAAEDEEGAAQAFYLMGLADTSERRLEAARADFETALERCERLGDRPGVALNLTALGWVALLAGDLPETIRRTGASLAAYRQLGGRFEVANALANLGHAAVRLGDVPLAELHYRDAAVEARAIEATSLLLEVLAGLADAELLRPQPDLIRAATSLGVALSHPRRTPDVETLARPVLDRLRGLLPPDDLDAALARGRGLDPLALLPDAGVVRA